VRFAGPRYGALQGMLCALLVALCLVLASAFVAPVMPSKAATSKVAMWFGLDDYEEDDDATRDPEPPLPATFGPNGEPQDFYEAETLADYLGRRWGPARAPAPVASDEWYDEDATRDLEPFAGDEFASEADAAGSIPEQGEERSEFDTPWHPGLSL